MQYVHFKSNHTKRFGHHLYILSLHFMWYLFGLIPGQRYAMCLADRIKSATPSIKGPKEVYLKRERGFFREFVSLGQLYIRKMFSCFTTPSGTHTHTHRRPQCLRFSQAQDGFGWIQTEDLIWGAKWTHGRLGVQQLVNQCSAVSVQAAAVWWVDGAAMQDCHWAVQVRWDDNEFFFRFLDFNIIYVCRRHLSMCVNMVMEQVCHVNSSRARAARPSLRTRIVTTRWPFVKLQRRSSATPNTRRSVRLSTRRAALLSWSATQVLEQRHFHDGCIMSSSPPNS